jgi:hypothetical protein
MDLENHACLTRTCAGVRLAVGRVELLETGLVAHVVLDDELGIPSEPSEKP